MAFRDRGNLPPSASVPGVAGLTSFSDLQLRVGTPPDVQHAIDHALADMRGRLFRHERERRAVHGAVDLATVARAVPKGRPKTGATTHLVIPGVQPGQAPGTIALVTNTARYTVLEFPTPVVVDQLAFAVTAGPASNASVRVGIYRADLDLQPTNGAPLVDQAVAVAAGATGKMVTASGLGLDLGPGVYLAEVNCDVAMTLRYYPGGPMHIDASMPATGSTYIAALTVAQAYGALPDPGLPWTATVLGNDGQRHVLALSVVTP